MKYRFRKHLWFDTEKFDVAYGIQGQKEGGDGSWLHVSERGKPLIFEAEAEADAKIKELNNTKANQ